MGNRFSVPGADQQTRGSRDAFLHPAPGDKQSTTAFPWIHSQLLTLSCTSPAPLAVPWEQTVAQPTPAFLQAFFHLPNKSSAARGSKTSQGNTCSSHLQSGPSSHKPQPLKSFSLLRGLFCHVIFLITDTNKARRNHFNWTQPKAGLFYLLPSANTRQVKSRLRRKSRWGSKSKSRLEVTKMGHLPHFISYAK